MTTTIFVLKIITLCWCYILGVLCISCLICELMKIFHLFIIRRNKEKDKQAEIQEDIESWNKGRCQFCGAPMEFERSWRHENGPSVREYKCSEDRNHPTIFIKHRVEKPEDFNHNNK